MADFQGVIIEESLNDKAALQDVKIESTKVEIVTEKHATPWLKQWTLHTVAVPQEKAETIAEKISRSLDSEHSWYADYKNNLTHFVIFRDKVFKIDRSQPEQYQTATDYGISLGIPLYQVDFSTNIKKWKR